MSAVCGQVVHAMVSARPGPYVLQAVRIGWYGGAGSRVVATSDSFVAGPQPSLPATDHAGSPGWRSSASLVVNASWPPGLYLVQLLRGAVPVDSAPLVVTAPLSGRRASVLFVVPAMTWTAYNEFGGRNLYRNFALAGRAGHEDRARTADIARPIAGAGVEAVDEYTAPLVRAVERAGLDVDYAADLDVDATPSLVDRRTEIVTGSHTEYVTRRVYDAFQAARDSGVNVAFLGGNGFYWQARVERDGRGRPRAVTVYRKPKEDPLARTAPQLTTTQWRHAPLNRPEAALLGAQYSGLGLKAPLVVLHAPDWLGWKAGEVIPDGLASEVDAVSKGVSPAGVQVLAGGAALVGGREVDGHVTYYSAASGAGVFDAASVMVGCSASGTCTKAGLQVPARTTTFWRDTIVKLVRAFVVARFGHSHPSIGTETLPTYHTLLQQYGPNAVGRSIGSPGD